MLTIAEVSGLIAAAVMTVQLVLPVAIVVILVKYLGTENSAVTWSVINRTISNTLWPHFIRADAVSTRGIPLKVVLPTWALTIGAILLVLAGVLTPIGLRDEIAPRELRFVPFQYVRDESPWGRVTMPRPNARFGRHCESGRTINCPGQYQGVYMNETEPGVISSVNTDEFSTVNTTIPRNFTEMFRSATSNVGNTVAGMFDIQYRRWKWDQDGIIDFGEPTVQGDSRSIGTLIPEDRILLTEGLIVDMRDNPSVGFRNHTVPMDLTHGGIWSEDILFVEPVTQCVDTNLTIELRLEDSVESFIDNATYYIVDRGAFQDLDADVLISPPWNDNQTLDLFGRAHLAARQWQYLVGLTWNVSMPVNTPSRTISPMKVTETAGAPPWMYNVGATEQNLMASLDGGLSGGGIGGVEPTIPDPTRANSTPPWVPRYEDGIKKLVALNYSSILKVCRGWYDLGSNIDLRANNLTYPAVECGYVLGAPVQTATPPMSASEYTGNSTASRNMYICATGVRAGVKNVEFRYNGTGKRLENLNVQSIKDKVYTDERSQPLWAVEHSYDRRMAWDPLWGIVDDRYESYGYDEGFYTLRAEKLWMSTSPHFATPLGVDGFGSLAAVSGFLRRLGNLYSSLVAGFDYTGQYDFSMLERFRSLAASQDRVGQILNLIYTDGMAASLVGTKTSISSKYVEWPASLAVDEVIEGTPAARVMVAERVIRYDIRYAIPAFIVLGVLLLALLWALLILITTRSTITDLRHVYNQTSAGRLATTLLLAEHAEPKQSSNQWARGDGRLPLKFGQMTKPEQDHFCKIATASGAHIIVRDQKDSLRGAEKAALLTVNPKST